ncbi:MAG: carboxymuconolactone decarboxylase family protein [Burkholderiaceae bacterium]
MTLPRVPMIPAAPTHDATLAEVLARWREIRGNDAELPTLYRVLGNAPALFRGWVDFAWPLRSEPRSERRLREMLILREAQICNARYEWAHHVPMALQAGVTRAQIAALSHWAQADVH